jgi:hypothetical protein
VSTAPQALPSSVPQMMRMSSRLGDQTLIKEAPNQNCRSPQWQPPKSPTKTLPLATLSLRASTLAAPPQHALKILSPSSPLVTRARTIEPKKNSMKRFDEKKRCGGHRIYACEASPLQPISTKTGPTFSDSFMGYSGEFVFRPIH